ncbi:MAG: glucosamine-6-phosphate deaminase [Propionibacteriaceae bacterium]|jgi:glucosamine-6-phosphate deaminase|nr:glucosamine-6-phosphate deaminase [Propionibacteriaceae bacterium]
MDVIICSDQDQAGARTAAKVAQVARQVGPRVVIGVATGSSPLQAYSALAGLIAAGRLDLGQASAFALDEYVGLPWGHPQSYHEAIRQTVTEPLGLDPTRVQVPNGFAPDLAQAARDYEHAIVDAGGVDIQILGVGSNGHIGFNEPTSSLSSRTRIKTLTEQTRIDNQRFFGGLEEVPRHCLTQGLGTIMDARHVVLVATGGHKARAVKAIVEGPITAMWPGSVLQLHRQATIVVDEAAAADLELAAYYRKMYDNLPDWQRLPLA